MRQLSAVVTTTFFLAIAACSSGGGISSEIPATDAGTSMGSASPESTAAPTGPPSTASSVTTPVEPADTEAPAASPGPETTMEPPSSTTDPTIERPFDVLVPSTYDPDTPIPLVVLLHGYSGTSDVVGDYFKLDSLAESRRFLLVSPDGTVDGQGFQYWNAMEACCSFGSDTPDDAAYLKAVIDQVSQDYNVDDRRIYLTGHSNGGFMSYRMACDFAETVAAVGSVAGATRGNDALCTPSEPVSVLQVHGTEDFVISYDGDDLEGAFVPSAPETVARWAVHNGCDSTPVPADNLDLDGFLPGSETEVETFENCARGSAVELWSIIGASHSPALTEDFANGLIDFFFDHPKP